MAKKAKAVPAVSHSPTGVYIYLGPTIHGMIWHGTIFYDTYQNVIEKNAAAIQKAPSIKKLIIKDSEVIEAKRLLKEGGNSLRNTKKKILSLN